MKPKSFQVILVIITVVAVLVAIASVLMLFQERVKNTGLQLTLTNEETKSAQLIGAYQELDNSFGIGPSSITLTSAQGNFTRGGYVSAEGSDDNRNKIGIYYHWGWCSSGGADCGTEICFSAPTPETNIHYYTTVNTPEANALYEKLKQNACKVYANIGLNQSCLSPAMETVNGDRVIFSTVLTKAENGSYYFAKGERQC